MGVLADAGENIENLAAMRAYWTPLVATSGNRNFSEINQCRLIRSSPRKKCR